ncbi:ATP-dependent RNA helicase HAS1 [Pelomyxa schiedti]|nr:ATP-dependent RNA helicase HAS1 [Pelomyxa schiedti]
MNTGSVGEEIAISVFLKLKMSAIEGVVHGWKKKKLKASGRATLPPPPSKASPSAPPSRTLPPSSSPASSSAKAARSKLFFPVAEHRDSRKADAEAAQRRATSAQSILAAVAPSIAAAAAAAATAAALSPKKPATTFEELPLCPETRRALAEDLKFSALTPIQAAAIPAALLGRDLMATARTGSGKTLAYLVPVVEQLWRRTFLPPRGTGGLVLCPTVELAVQIGTVCERLMAHHRMSRGWVCAGGNRSAESTMLEAGVNVLVGTPARLVHHIENTSMFVYSELQCLVLDEADMLLGSGASRVDVEIIAHTVPAQRQTMLFSATLTRQTSIEPLVLRNPEFVDMESRTGNKGPTSEAVDQNYIVVPTAQRVELLLTLLKVIPSKVVVFFATTAEVTFFSAVLPPLLKNTKLKSLHKDMSRGSTNQTFWDFFNAWSGVLFTTDIAARGIDIPDIDWIIQFDIPSSAEMYVHRVGRTARAGTTGHALMFVQPTETRVVSAVCELGVPLAKLALPKLDAVSESLQKVISGDATKREMATAALDKYISSYALHQRTYGLDPVDIHNLALSFGVTSYTPKTPVLQQQPVSSTPNSTATSKKKKKKKKKNPKTQKPNSTTQTTTTSTSTSVSHEQPAPPTPKRPRVTPSSQPAIKKRV